MNQSTVFMLTLGVGTTGLLAYFCYKNSYPVKNNSSPVKNNSSIDTKSYDLKKTDEIEEGYSLLSIFNKLAY